MLLYRWVSSHRLLVKPTLFHSASLIFLLGMMPWFDSIARYSIWIHSTQSVMVHHLAPLLWIIALQHPVDVHTEQRDNKPSWHIIAMFLLFAVLTWGWMLPAIHPLLMQSALAYSLMKWLMALSGLALCFTMLSKTASSHYWRWLNGMMVTFPLVLLGSMMLIFPDLYQSAHSSMHHQHMMMTNVPDWLLLAPYEDQFLGGVIFIVAAYFYWLKEASSNRFSGHARRIPE
tara:strand:- start:39499 stop:40188 length:690 start_codon:yes stop_codon:yes gene_type:complete